MKRLLLLTTVLLGAAAVASGIVHVVEVDDAGQVVFAPRVDRVALHWWSERADRVVTAASTFDEALAADFR